jgi:hypothetical protein
MVAQAEIIELAATGDRSKMPLIESIARGCYRTILNTPDGLKKLPPVAVQSKEFAVAGD